MEKMLNIQTNCDVTSHNYFCAKEKPVISATRVSSKLKDQLAAPFHPSTAVERLQSAMKTHKNSRAKFNKTVTWHGYILSHSALVERPQTHL
jgi:hypothetical protein